MTATPADSAASTTFTFDPSNPVPTLGVRSFARVNASMAAVTGVDPQTPAVDAGETDAELYDIFMEQLVAGLGQLVETAGRMARNEGAVEAAAEMADQMERLSTAGNYMGYDALTAVYADMLTELAALASRLETAGPGDIDTFLQATVVGGVGRIQELFPQAGSLMGIDMTAGMASGLGVLPKWSVTADADICLVARCRIGPLRVDPAAPKPESDPMMPTELRSFGWNAQP